MGIGTHLFVMLAYAAKERGVDFFEVEILRENTEVIKTMQRSGLELVGKSEKHDKWRATYRLVPTPSAEIKQEEHEKISSVASITRFMRPRSIAVLGASNKPGIGNEFIKNLIGYGYKGVIYPINPRAEYISYIKTYPSIMDVPGDVDLAVMVVASEKVQPLVEECARKGVKALVVKTDE